MLSNSRAAFNDHDHQRCVSAALASAEALCKTQALRLTPIRKSVLALIWQHHKPMGAYDIVEKLSQSRGKRVQAPTVYRAIEFLLNHGLVHRIASLNAYIGCPFPSSSHSDIFLICRECQTAVECATETVNAAIATTVAKSGFSMESQSVEIMGLCPNCQAVE